MSRNHTSHQPNSVHFERQAIAPYARPNPKANNEQATPLSPIKKIWSWVSSWSSNTPTQNEPMQVDEEAPQADAGNTEINQVSESGTEDEWAGDGPLRDQDIFAFSRALRVSKEEDFLRRQAQGLKDGETPGGVRQRQRERDHRRKNPSAAYNNPVPTPHIPGAYHSPPRVAKTKAKQAIKEAIAKSDKTDKRTSDRSDKKKSKSHNTSPKRADNPGQSSSNSSPESANMSDKRKGKQRAISPGRPDDWVPPVINHSPESSPSKPISIDEEREQTPSPPGGLPRTLEESPKSEPTPTTAMTTITNQRPKSPIPQEIISTPANVSNKELMAVISPLVQIAAANSQQNYISNSVPTPSQVSASASATANFFQIKSTQQSWTQHERETAMLLVKSTMMENPPIENFYINQHHHHHQDFIDSPAAKRLSVYNDIPLTPKRGGRGYFPWNTPPPSSTKSKFSLSRFFSKPSDHGEQSGNESAQAQLKEMSGFKRPRFAVDRDASAGRPRRDSYGYDNSSDRVADGLSLVNSMSSSPPRRGDSTNINLNFSVAPGLQIDSINGRTPTAEAIAKGKKRSADVLAEVAAETIGLDNLLKRRHELMRYNEYDRTPLLEPQPESQSSGFTTAPTSPSVPSLSLSTSQTGRAIKHIHTRGSGGKLQKLRGYKVETEKDRDQYLDDLNRDPKTIQRPSTAQPAAKTADQASRFNSMAEVMDRLKSNQEKLQASLTRDIEMEASSTSKALAAIPSTATINMSSNTSTGSSAQMSATEMSSSTSSQSITITQEELDALVAKAKKEGEEEERARKRKRGASPSEMTLPTPAIAASTTSAIPTTPQVHFDEPMKPYEAPQLQISQTQRPKWAVAPRTPSAALTEDTSIAQRIIQSSTSRNKISAPVFQPSPLKKLASPPEEEDDSLRRKKRARSITPPPEVTATHAKPSQDLPSALFQFHRSPPPPRKETQTRRSRPIGSKTGIQESSLLKGGFDYGFTFRFPVPGSTSSVNPAVDTATTTTRRIARPPPGKLFPEGTTPFWSTSTSTSTSTSSSAVVVPTTPATATFTSSTVPSFPGSFSAAQPQSQCQLQSIRPAGTGSKSKESMAWECGLCGLKNPGSATEECSICSEPRPRK